MFILKSLLLILNFTRNDFIVWTPPPFEFRIAGSASPPNKFMDQRMLCVNLQINIFFDKTYRYTDKPDQLPEYYIINYV